MATLQRINQALLLQLRTQQDANQINANLALQQMIAQKQQQDALKAGFIDAGNFNSSYQAQVTPAYNGAAQALIY
jgi:type III secretory pathway lipoprotein EscJ